MHKPKEIIIDQQFNSKLHVSWFLSTQHIFTDIIRPKILIMGENISQTAEFIYK